MEFGGFSVATRYQGAVNEQGYIMRHLFLSQ